MKTERLSEIIGQIYDDVVDYEQWRLGNSALEYKYANYIRANAVHSSAPRRTSDVARPGPATTTHKNALSFQSRSHTIPVSKSGANDHEIRSVLAKHVLLAKKIRDFRDSVDRHEAIRKMASGENNIPLAVLIVGLDFKIRETDGAAKQLLQTGNGLADHGNTLASTSKKRGQKTKNLHEYIAVSDPSSAPFIIEGDNTAVLCLRIVGLNSDTDAPALDDAKAIVVSVSSVTAPLNIDSFKTAYGLTNAEAKFLVALAKVDTATKAAENLNISRNTAKSHLTSIFQKTDCCSQNQLMLLLGRLSG